MSKNKGKVKPAAKIKTPATKPVGKLAGKNVAMVGKFGYSDFQRNRYEQLVAMAGGKVVDPAKIEPDYLFVGEGRGGKPPGEVAKLEKQYPAMQVLDLAAVARLLLPKPEDILWQLAHRTEMDYSFWEEIPRLGRESGATIDMQGFDLRKTKASGTHFEAMDLTDADFRQADVTYLHFPAKVAGANFEGCDGKHAYFLNLEQCKFKGADLEKVWMFFSQYYSGPKITIAECDFTGAKMSGAKLDRGAAADCYFKGVDLQDADLEETTFTRCDFSGSDLSRVHGAQAKFTEVSFAKANLYRADLRDALLAGADLRGANLREAVLSNANLTGADVAGADFQDAVLTDAKLSGVDFSKAKNFRAPVVRKAGPKVHELVVAAKGSKSFSTSVEVDLGKDEFARLRVDFHHGRCGARSDYTREGSQTFDRIQATTLEQGMLGLANRWPKGTLRLDSVEAKGSKSLRGQKLKDLATAAWAEAFGIADGEDLKAGSAEQQAQALRERDELMKKIRKQGGKIWNDLDYRLRDRIDLQGADLSGAKLDKITMWSCNVKGANFAKSSLKKAELWNTQAIGANFSGANLEGARLENLNLTGANLVGANLTRAEMANVKLQGADLTRATLLEAKLDKAQFDHKTILPWGFKPPDQMLWKGNGPRPGSSTKKIKPAQSGSLDFASFLVRLAKSVDAGRMAKARSMLKAEKFQLFADVQSESLVGIVKSQTDKNLVYSCRLTDSGAFSCCTQNLRPCGGLQGSLCKHLLVLIVGLAKSGQFDSATADNWIKLSKRQKPAIDQDLMTAAFLRFKGAEAGEVDWRPTETIPEDFYAM